MHSKMYSASCIYTHMTSQLWKWWCFRIEKIEYQEWNMIFPRNRKILNCASKSLFSIVNLWVLFWKMLMCTQPNWFLFLIIASDVPRSLSFAYIFHQFCVPEGSAMCDFVNTQQIGGSSDCCKEICYLRSSDCCKGIY